MKFIKKPVYDVSAKIDWEEPVFVGEDVEFMQENDYPMISGYDIYKIDKDNMESFLVASVNSDVDSLVDRGDEKYKVYRSDSILANTTKPSAEEPGNPNEPGSANSTSNDDAITKGFRYGTQTIYRIIPAPLVDSKTDVYGRRKFLSDIKSNETILSVDDIHPPRKITTDAYNVLYDSREKLYSVSINFQPLNGDGVGILKLENEGEVRGRYEVWRFSGSAVSVPKKYYTLQQPGNLPNNDFRVPFYPRAGQDTLLPNVYDSLDGPVLDREVDIIQLVDQIPSGSLQSPETIKNFDPLGLLPPQLPKPGPIKYKITATSFNRQVSEPRILDVYLTPMKKPGPIYASVSHFETRGGDGPTRGRVPSAVVLNWTLVGSGTPETPGIESNFVEIWRSIDNNLQDDISPPLERLGIFEIPAEHIDRIDFDKTGIADRNVYEYIDDNFVWEDLTKSEAPLKVRYTIRTVNPRDVIQKVDDDGNTYNVASPNGYQASEFQQQMTNIYGSKQTNSKYIGIELALQPPTSDFSDFIIPGLSAQDIREMNKKPIITNREFMIESKSDADRVITLVIVEPETGNTTERKFNLKK